MFKRNYKKFFAGACLGGGLGAVAGLLCTKKGKKWQEEFMKKYKKYEGKLYQLTNEGAPVKKIKRKVRKAIKAVKSSKSRKRHRARR